MDAHAREALLGHLKALEQARASEEAHLKAQEAEEADLQAELQALNERQMELESRLMSIQMARIASQLSAKSSAAHISVVVNQIAMSQKTCARYELRLKRLQQIIGDIARTRVHMENLTNTAFS
mmetsp:Transcript_10748/g.18976  ORF Transcript_10748/g.18976 Transcript_10748/m.18976 type:complete len:124 (+) Transcript_10748:301-672(+)